MKNYSFIHSKGAITYFFTLSLPNAGDPFYGEFSSDDQSVTIEAINCDGQSARVNY